MAQLRQSKKHERGMTLVELLIVVTLIALLTGSVMFGSGMLGSSRLRSAATLVLSATRLAQSRASSIGRPVRLVFDLDNQRIDMQESVSRQVTRVRSAEDLPEEDLASKLEAGAREEAERVTDNEPGKAPKARFAPAPQFAEDLGDETKGSGKSLGRGILFRQVSLGRDAEPRTKGRVAVYFWPGGETERASVQLQREHSESGLTIMLSALTGRARIEQGFVELPESPIDGVFSEREEE